MAQSLYSQTYAQAVTLYVAPDGDDCWSGRLPTANRDRSDGPFASLVRGRDAAREIRAQRAKTNGGSPPVTVVILEGTYRLSEPLVFGPQDSGVADAPLSLVAYPGQRPVLSGSVVLSDWRPYKTEIFQCCVPALKGRKIRQLFCDGERQRRARWPHFAADDPLYGGWAFMEKPLSKGFVYESTLAPQPWANPEEAEVAFFPWYCWVNDLIALQAIDTQSRTIKLVSGPFYAMMELTKGNRFIVENVLEEIEPGQWCFHSATGTFFFWPQKPLATTSISVPVTDRLLEIGGEQNAPACHITISGLTFTETSSPFPEQLSANFHSPPHRGEAVRLENTQYCRVEGNRFRNLGGEGVRLHGSNSHNRVVGNRLSHTGGSAISISSDAPGNLSTWTDKQQLKQKLAQYPRCAHNVVSDNRIDHCGQTKKNCAGIQVYGIASVDNVLAHNHIHHTSDKGVTIQDGFGRLFVEYNELHDIASEIADTGAIMTNRWFVDEDEPATTGSVYRFNLIYDIFGCGAYDSPKEGKPVMATTAAGRIWTPYYNWGIYFDNSAMYCTVYGNIVVRAVLGGVSIPVGDPKGNIIANNIFVDCRAAQADLRIGGTAARDNRFLRNILYYSEPQAALLAIGARTNQSFCECDYNLYFAGDKQRPQVARHVDGDHESLSLEEWRKMGHDAHSLVADPQIEDVRRGDFRLKPGSPAFLLGFVPIDQGSIGPREARRQNL